MTEEESMWFPIPFKMVLDSELAYKGLERPVYPTILPIAQRVELHGFILFIGVLM